MITVDPLNMPLDQLDEHWRGRSKEEVNAEIEQHYEGWDREALQSLNRSRSS